MVNRSTFNNLISTYALLFNSIPSLRGKKLDSFSLSHSFVSGLLNQLSWEDSLRGLAKRRGERMDERSLWQCEVFFSDNLGNLDLILRKFCKAQDQCDFLQTKVCECSVVIVPALLLSAYIVLVQIRILSSLLIFWVPQSECPCFMSIFLQVRKEQSGLLATETNVW